MRLIKTLNFIAILLITTACTFSVFGQFRIRVPKIKKPKTNKPKPTQKIQEKNSAITNIRSNRQMVMDDGYTFFDAEPVKGRHPKLSLSIDVGWYLKSNLRMLGTFPRRSAFKIVVKKNGNTLATTRCEGSIYKKSNDSSLGSAALRRGKDLNFEDFMTSPRCFNKEAVIKPTGKMEVEIYFINGDTDAETLVRTHKIDVRRASRVRGSASKPQPDVAHYYIQRHAESAVAILHITGNHTGRGKNAFKNYYWNIPSTMGSPVQGQVQIYFSYSPGRRTKNSSNNFARCSVNGQRIRFQRDSVSLQTKGSSEYAIYLDRIAQKYKRGSAYRDDVIFRRYTATFPIYTGKRNTSLTLTKLEENPGKWECQIIANGVKFRTFRWEVGSDGKIIPHAEQKNGNVNLYYKTYLIDMEIPKGGAPFDHRLMPMPNAGLFYGIPWTSAEGKRMAAKVPNVGNPFHVPSNKAN